jgi:Arc/MetJ-type ribon-helix-helix transcriptional regulator
MSRQIAVRLPDEILEFVDEVVSQGKAKSRAAVVTRALERERRRAAAERDVAILTQGGGDPDMDALVEHVARTPLDLE